MVNRCDVVFACHPWKALTIPQLFLTVIKHGFASSVTCYNTVSTEIFHRLTFHDCSRTETTEDAAWMELTKYGNKTRVELIQILSSWFV
jgi:hypothetical protein